MVWAAAIVDGEEQPGGVRRPGKAVDPPVRLSVRFTTLPVLRSSTSSRHRSLSYPARNWARHAMYLPSGEYRGLASAPGVLVILRGGPPAMETAYTSVLVLAGGHGVGVRGVADFLAVRRDVRNRPPPPARTAARRACRRQVPRSAPAPQPPAGGCAACPCHAAQCR